MKYLAQCVVRYAQCLWQAQPLLPPPADTASTTTPQGVPAALVDDYLAGLLASLAELPADERAALSRAARMGLKPVLASQRRPDPIRHALIAGELPPPPQSPTAQAPWRDASLAAVALRSLRYALDLTESLPDPQAAAPATCVDGEQHAALWSAAHVLEDQQAALWDMIETVSAVEAASLAEAACKALHDVPPDSQQAELLAYFASGMFAQRVQAKG